MLQHAAIAPNASIRVWQQLALRGTLVFSHRLYQRSDRLPNVLGQVGPCGHNGGRGKRRPKANPERTPKTYYTKDSYRHAIRGQAKAREIMARIG